MAYNQYSQQPQPPRNDYQEQPPPQSGSNGGYQYMDSGQHYDGYQPHYDQVQQSAQPYGNSNGHAQRQPAGGGRGGRGRGGGGRGGDRPAQGYQQPDGYHPPQPQSDRRQHPTDHGQRGRGQQYTSNQTRPSQDRGERHGREKHRPPDLSTQARSKTKSRERILPAVQAPVIIGWDNPFPAFNAKKKDAKKNVGVDKDLPKVNSPSQSEQRPQTSHSHTAAEQARPHTSQGHRRPDPLVTSPGPRSANPMSPSSPFVAQHAKQNDLASPRSAKSDHAPARPPITRLASERPATNGHDDAVAVTPKTQRSMTMPEEVATGMGNRKLQKIPNGQLSRNGSDYGKSPQEPYHYVPTPISPVASPPTSAVGTNRIAVADSAPASHNILLSPEMPNFDAMSPTANEKSEDPLERARPAYQKASYAAPVGFAASYRGLPPSQRVPTPGDRPEFAGFAFDLPNSDNFQRSPPPMGSHTTHSSYSQISPTSRGQHSPRAELQNQPYNLPVAGPYAARSGSGPGSQQPQSVSTPQRYGSQNSQPSQYGSAGAVQQYPTVDSYRSPSHDIAPDYGPREHNGGARRNPPPQEQQRFYPSQGQYPTQDLPPQDLGHGSQQFPGQPSSRGHPPPSRQHPSSNTASLANPDALPAHPVPVRPGLLRKESAGTAPTSERSGVSYPAPAPNLAPMPVLVPAKNPMPVTAFDLNLLVQTIKKNPNDKATMMTLVKKLVEAASILSSEGGKADAKTTQKNRERYITDAHKHLKKLVHKGYGDATFYMAECYGHGRLGLPVDPKEAFHLYTSAAKGGHAQAAYRVGVCCEMGIEEGGGTRRDPIKAVHWYKRAASMGDTPAMYKVGVILLKGLLGQPRNPREALSWLKRAADQADRDNPHALHELALLHETATPGDTIIKDEGYSRQLFVQAAELGYKYSQFRLGSAFEYGLLGCAIDARHSIAWYTQAAGQGEHQAELALSGWYLTGSDGILQQSDTEAFLWARKAASSGLAKAEYAMGYFTEVGIGCTASLDEAKKWYWRAASQNFPQARERLEDLKKGGGKMQKTRVSRSAMNRGNNEGECRVM